MSNAPLCDFTPRDSRSGTVFARWETDEEYRLRLSPRSYNSYLGDYSSDQLDACGVIYNTPRRIVMETKDAG